MYLIKSGTVYIYIMIPGYFCFGWAENFSQTETPLSKI